MNQNEKYAYLAGFVDADGSISIKTQSKARPFVGYITVYNCNKMVIEMFFTEFGGGKSRYKKTGRGRNEANWRPCWEWQLTAQKAAKAIQKIYPFLVIKKRQAELVLELCKLKPNGRKLARWKPDQYRSLQKQLNSLKIECKRLNQRGVPDISKGGDAPRQINQ